MTNSNGEFTAYEANDGETWYKAEDEEAFVLCIHDEWIYLTMQDLQRMQALIQPLAV